MCRPIGREGAPPRTNSNLLGRMIWRKLMSDSKQNVSQRRPGVNKSNAENKSPNAENKSPNAENKSPNAENKSPSTESAKDTHKEMTRDYHHKDASTRDLLLTAAKRVFAEQGFDGATVKALADAAGVNVSLVSYYFGGKEGLYKTCLEQFGRERMATCERILKPVETAEDFRLRIEMFADEFLRANLRDLHTCRILHRDLETGSNPFAMEIFTTAILPVFTRLVEFISSAQKAGVVRPTMDANEATVLMFGSLMHVVKTDSVRKLVRNETLADEKVLERTVRTFVLLFSDGVLQRTEK